MKNQCPLESLTNLPNIGKTLAAKLNKVDIHTAEQLKEIGSEDTIIKIAT
jgi:DNA transformation protein